jgi:hypothetical protein
VLCNVIFFFNIKEHNCGYPGWLPIAWSRFLSMVYTIVDIIFLCDFEVALVARYVVPAFSCVDVGNLCIAGELDRLKLFDDVVNLIVAFFDLLGDNWF